LAWVESGVSWISSRKTVPRSALISRPSTLAIARTRRACGFRNSPQQVTVRPS
jgi:hypothetical protein